MENPPIFDRRIQVSGFFSRCSCTRRCRVITLTPHFLLGDVVAARSPAWEVATECRDAKYLTAAGSCEYLCPEGTYPAGSGGGCNIRPKG